MLTFDVGEFYSYTEKQLWDRLMPGGPWQAWDWNIEPGRSILPSGMSTTETTLTGTPTAAGTGYKVVLRQVNGMGETKAYHDMPITVTGAVVPDPEPEPAPDLAAAMVTFLGASDDSEVIALAAVHVPIMTTMVKAYTRDRGFVAGQPNEDLQAVILTAGARLVVNPEQGGRLQLGDYSETKAVFSGYTLAELAVLNRYRRRAA